MKKLFSCGLTEFLRKSVQSAGKFRLGIMKKLLVGGKSDTVLETRPIGNKTFCLPLEILLDSWITYRSIKKKGRLKIDLRRPLLEYH